MVFNKEMELTAPFGGALAGGAGSREDAKRQVFLW
jgi:hypothetical protein